MCGDWSAYFVFRFAMVYLVILHLCIPKRQYNIRAGNRHMKRAKSLFFMDFHRLEYCLDVDGEIRSPWNACFKLMHWFQVLPCAPIEIDARFS